VKGSTDVCTPLLTRLRCALGGPVAPYPTRAPHVCSSTHTASQPRVAPVAWLWYCAGCVEAAVVCYNRPLPPPLVTSRGCPGVVDRQRLFAFLAESSFFREEAVDFSPNRVSLEKQRFASKDVWVKKGQEAAQASACR